MDGDPTKRVKFCIWLGANCIAARSCEEMLRGVFFVAAFTERFRSYPRIAVNSASLFAFGNVEDLSCSEFGLSKAR